MRQSTAEAHPSVNPIWTKAPLLLLRFPKVLLAIFGSALILGVAGVAGPLFLSSSGSAALRDQLEEVSRFDAGLGIGEFVDLDAEAAASLDDRAAVLERVVGSSPLLGDPLMTIVGPAAPVRSHGERTQVRLVARTEAAEHLEMIDGEASGGLVVSEVTAEALGVSPGSRVGIGPRRFRVSGIYASLVDLPPTEYWEPLAPLIYPDASETTPPALMIVDHDLMFDIGDAIGAEGNLFWVYPFMAEEVGLAEARGVAHELDEIVLGVEEAQRVQDPRRAEVVDLFAEGGAQSVLSDVVDAASETVAALEGPVFVLSLAARVVALLVIAAAGAYVIATRRVESDLLTSKGLGPLLQGARVAVESVLPLVAGAGAGALLGWLLVKEVGPSDLVEGDALRDAVTFGSATLVAGLAALAASAAVSAARVKGPTGERPNVLARVPWEALVLGLAAAAYYEIVARDSVIIETPEGPKIDVFVLLFPILFLMGAAGLFGRALRWLLPRLHSFGRGSPPPVYLAIRRLAGAPGMVLALVTASVLAVGILVYAQSLASTVAASFRAKAGVFLGSDVSARVFPATEIPRDFPLPATKVIKVEPLETTSGIQFRMIGVDRSTFADAAFWDPTFADEDLDTLLARLDRAGDSLPVILAGGGRVADTAAVDLTNDVPVEVVARVRAFPGLPAGSPLMVADAQAMDHALDAGDSIGTTTPEGEIWIRGEPDRVEQAITEYGVASSSETSVREVLARPTLSSMSWTLQLFRALGVAAGGIVLLAILLYMQARQRSAIVSYALARRMGLTDAQQTFSNGLELAAILGLAVAGGSVIAIVVARLIYVHLDLLPEIPPPPLLRIPIEVVAILVLVGIVGAVVGGRLVQRGARRARVAEVLRLAE